MMANSTPTPQLEETFPETGEDTPQTQFGLEEPLFEQTVTPNLPQSKVVSPIVILGLPWYKKPLGLALLATGALILIVFMLLMLATPKATQILDLTPPEPVVTTQVSDPLKLKIRQLKAELIESDPTNQALPFPPVSIDLQLAPLNNRKN